MGIYVEPYSDARYEYAFPEADFPLTVMHMENALDINMHRHNFYEMVIVTAGNAVHEVGKCRYTLSSRDVFFLPPGLFHAYFECDNFCYFNILMDLNKLKLAFFDLKDTAGWKFLTGTMINSFLAGQEAHCVLSPAIFSRCCEDLKKIIAGQLETFPGCRFVRSALLQNTLFNICSAIGQMEITTREYSGAGSGNFSFSNLARSLANNSGSIIPIAELCSKLGLSRSTLYREFKRRFGMNPVEFQLRHKLRNAAAMLLHSNSSVGDIAMQYHFANPAHFAMLFRKEFGISPREYRNKNQLKNP